MGCKGFWRAGEGVWTCPYRCPRWYKGVTLRQGEDGEGDPSSPPTLRTLPGTEPSPLPRSLSFALLRPFFEFGFWAVWLLSVLPRARSRMSLLMAEPLSVSVTCVSEPVSPRTPSPPPHPVSRSAWLPRQWLQVGYCQQLSSPSQIQLLWGCCFIGKEKKKQTTQTSTSLFILFQASCIGGAAPSSAGACGQGAEAVHPPRLSPSPAIHPLSKRLAEVGGLGLGETGTPCAPPPPPWHGASHRPAPTQGPPPPASAPAPSRCLPGKGLSGLDML